MKTFGIHDSYTQCPRGYNLIGLTVPEKSDKNILMFENGKERKMKN